MAHACANDVPALDLLPLFANYIKEHDLMPRDLFLDALHLTPLGSRVAAEAIVEFLAREKMLPEETTEAVRRQKPSALCPDIL